MYKFTNGDYKKIKSSYLLQPYWVCTNNWINNVQKWINIQVCKWKGNGSLFGFLWNGLNLIKKMISEN